MSGFEAMAHSDSPPFELSEAAKSMERRIMREMEADRKKARLDPLIVTKPPEPGEWTTASELQTLKRDYEKLSKDFKDLSSQHTTLEHQVTKNSLKIKALTAAMECHIHDLPGPFAVTIESLKKEKTQPQPDSPNPGPGASTDSPNPGPDASPDHDKEEDAARAEDADGATATLELEH